MVVLLMEREKLTLILKLMLVYMGMAPLEEALSLLQPQSAVLFLLGLVTRFLLTYQGRLQRLFARLLLTSRSSRTVLTLSAPLAPSNLSSNLNTPLLLEVTLRLDLLLLLPTVEQFLWAVLVLRVDMELVLLLVGMELVPLVVLSLVVSLVVIPVV